MFYSYTWDLQDLCWAGTTLFIWLVFILIQQLGPVVLCHCLWCMEYWLSALSAWVAMAEEVAWGNERSSSLFSAGCWGELRGGRRLTATVSQSWSAVRDRERGALLLMLIAGWQASCFLQQGNICGGTEQMYQNRTVALESAIYPPYSHTSHYITEKISMKLDFLYVSAMRGHCFVRLSVSFLVFCCTHSLIQI